MILQVLISKYGVHEPMTRMLSHDMRPVCCASANLRVWLVPHGLTELPKLKQPHLHSSQKDTFSLCLETSFPKGPRRRLIM